MILPIDRKVNDRIPFVTYGLIVVNSLILFTTLVLAQSVEQLHGIYREYGLVPSSLQIHAIGTHMFMHGGIWHLIGNMVFLGFFGLNVERRLGALLFLALYLFSGLTSLGLFLVFDPRSDIPLVGASGAISGVTGMYLALYQGRLVSVFSIAGPFKARAFAFILIWAGTEVFYAILLSKEVTVAHWAHVGGFLGGWITVFALLRIGFRGHPERSIGEPKDLSLSFTQLRYIPVNANTKVRAHEQFALVFKHEQPPPPMVKELLPNDATPACATRGLSLVDAENLQHRLTELGVHSRVIPEENLVRLPPMELLNGIAVGGQVSMRDELNHEIARDPDFFFLLSAGQVGDRTLLDIFITSPWTNYRVSDALAENDLTEMAADLRRRLPHSHLSPGFQALSERRPDRIPSFESQHDYDQHNRWVLQSLVSVGGQKGDRQGS